MGRHKLSNEDVALLMRSPKEYASKKNTKLSSALALQYKQKTKLKKELLSMERGEQPFEPEELQRVRELLQDFKDHGLPVEPEDAPMVRKIQMHEMGYTDADGEAHTQLQRNVEFRPAINLTDDEVISRATPAIIKPAKAVRKKSKDKVAVIVPDLQGGYRRHSDGELEPIHDEKVVEVGLQIIRHLEPDLIVMNGDNLDFPDLSRFAPDSNHFQGVMQATLQRVHDIMAAIRANAGEDCKIVWLEGNHEARLRKTILNANDMKHLWGVTAPGRTYPYGSIPDLLSLDELDIQYISGYPANTFRINDRLQASHGHKVRSNGSTAAAMAASEELSTIFGHVHRIESHSRTNQLGRTITGLSYGCWARVDGAVPSYGNGVTDDGQVIKRYENWQNGMGVIHYQEGDHPFQEHAIRIDHTEDYETHYDGKVFKPE